MSQVERNARRIAKDLKEQAVLIAQHMTPPPGTVRYSSRDERKAFWQRHPDIPPGEAEDAVWLGFIDRMTQQFPGMSLEDAQRIAAPHVAMAVYPARAVVVRQGDRRIDIDKQIDFSNRMEKLGPPVDDEPEGSNGYGP